MATQIKAVITKDRYETKIEAEGNFIISDEKSSAGGGNKGFTPFELLASSLASCTCITLRMYIDKKQWDIEGVEVLVNLTQNEANESTHFERIILFKGSVADEHRERLLEIANLCPIHKTLSKSIYINTLIR